MAHWRMVRVGTRSMDRPEKWRGNEKGVGGVGKGMGGVR